jgi:hypothetical protein
VIPAGSEAFGLARALFEHDVRREGRLVATLRARQGPSGVVVESEVFPVTQAPGSPGIPRPFPFASFDQARRFAEDALVAFEYLDCTVS